MIIRLALMYVIAIQIFCVSNVSSANNTGIEMTFHSGHDALTPSMEDEDSLDKEITAYIQNLKDNLNLEANVKMQLHEEGAEYKIRFAIKELFKCFENRDKAMEVLNKILFNKNDPVILDDKYKSCDSFYISALVKDKRLNKRYCFKRLYYNVLLKAQTCRVPKPDYAEYAAIHVTNRELSPNVLKMLYIF